jgi:hypothetical protein
MIRFPSLVESMWIHYSSFTILEKVLSSIPIYYFNAYILQTSALLEINGIDFVLFYKDKR